MLPSETTGDQFFNRVRIGILRLFGAKIGTGVILRNSCEIYYPWNLEIGDHAWVGYGANLYNLLPIRLKNHSCVSQNAFLCTGSHDPSDPYMGLIAGEIVVEDGAWIGANSFILPGVTIGREAVVAAGSVVTKDVPPRSIAGGNPAEVIRERIFRVLAPGEGGGMKVGSVLIAPGQLLGTSHGPSGIRNQQPLIQEED